ncbi:MAG TPA: GNAT family N-acetyltransferase [Chloroflexi bacterium]|jgi:GNAT superfamily N-acetyltransferase|nr:GNAT family N-acetyltransferase [Chloroflexota bacterium]
MLITKATVDDAAEILALQKLAFQSEAALYNDYSIAPLTQTLDDLIAQFSTHVILKAVVDGRIVGSVRGTLRDGTCHIGRLVVHPDYQNRGIGKQLMSAIEAHYGDARRYEIFTGNRSERTLYLYGKLGYHEFRREPSGGEVVIVYLEKAVHNLGPA